MVSAGEHTIFEAFIAVRPDFAGRALECKPGADPPDFIGTDAEGKRVGVELGEWLNEEQMRISVARERKKDSFMSAVKSEEVEPPTNVGMVWMGKLDGVALRAEDAAQFQKEIFAYVAEIDRRWQENDEWHGRQGHPITDFSKYPTVAKYLGSLTFISRERMPTIKGIAWLTFPGEGGAYTPRDAVDALLELIRKKTAKYAYLHKEQRLSELYLVAYYDRALIYNTPYIGPGFGWDEIAAIAGAEIAKNPGAFQKVFLFNSLPDDMTVTELWPG
jgi:hypothetical protein